MVGAASVTDVLEQELLPNNRDESGRDNRQRTRELWLRREWEGDILRPSHFFYFCLMVRFFVSEGIPLVYFGASRKQFNAFSVQVM